MFRRSRPGPLPARPTFHRVSGALAALVFALALLAGCASTEIYVVQPGDSLSQIALSHDVTLTELIRANEDEYPSLAVDPDHPPAGATLVIPTSAGIGLESWFARLSQPASPLVTPAPDVPAAPTDKINAIVQLVHRGINHERAAHNLTVLGLVPALSAIAQARSNDMIRRGYFSHTDPQTGAVAFQDLLRSSVVKYLFIGENIAEIRNQGTLVPSRLTVYSLYGPAELADQFVTGWINSAEHRENILNPHFTKTGVALGVSVDGTRLVATQIFAD